MARRKEHSAEARKSAVLKPKPSSISKRTAKVKQTRAVTPRPSHTRVIQLRMAAALAGNYKPVYLENELLDTTKAPEYVAQKVRRNATASPLLRLPGEIRNKIWEYASTGSDIVLGWKFRYRFHYRYGNRRHRYQYGILNGPDNYLTSSESAFHLPQVCRQIYSETATLAHSLFTLIFAPEYECEAFENTLKTIKAFK